MKIRSSFVANSSSSSFILMIREGERAKISIPNLLTLHLDDLCESYEEDATYDHFRYNWKPSGFDEAYEESLRSLKSIWLRRLMFNNNPSKLTDAMTYARNAANTTLHYGSSINGVSYDMESLIQYYLNEYGYFGNTFDLMKRMLKDYYDNFIIPINKHIRSKLEDYTSFDDFYKWIMDLDNGKCFSFQQYICNLSIHNQGIFAVNPISYEEHYTVCKPTNTAEMERNSTLWYNSVIQEMIRIKKILLVYLYCYCTNSLIQCITFGDSDNYKVDTILDELYRSTRFRRPFTNFDVLEECRS